MIALADCAVVVSNAQETARWWNEKLGFVIHTVGGGGHAVSVAPPGDKFVVHLCEGFAPLEPGNTGIAFVTDDFAALVGRLEAGGVAFPEPPRRGGLGGTARFADPDGNVFWLIEAPTAFIRQEAYARAPQPPPSPTSGRARVKPSRRRARPAARKR
jgi:catechol 2,3-dioxygenase-like lactoylglutathione lyase family enzyme